MVWRCTCGFEVFLPLFFINFFHFFDLVFSRSNYYWNRYLVGATAPTVFYQSFWNYMYAYLFYMVWRCACDFGAILLSYGFISHNPLLTKPWRRGTLARNTLLFRNFDAEITEVPLNHCLSFSFCWAIVPYNTISVASCYSLQNRWNGGYFCFGCLFQICRCTELLSSI